MAGKRGLMAVWKKWPLDLAWRKAEWVVGGTLGNK
jgi:hypothetical protein